MNLAVKKIMKFGPCLLVF